MDALKAFPKKSIFPSSKHFHLAWNVPDILHQYG